MNIIEINPSNIEQYGLYCTNSKSAQTGIRQKLDWFTNNYLLGLRTFYAIDNNTIVGFLEYSTKEHYRNVIAENYIVINCLWGKPGTGSALLEKLIAESGLFSGICALTSENMWLCDKAVFLKNGFSLFDEYHFTIPIYGKTRVNKIELLCRKNNPETIDPKFDYSYIKNIEKLEGINIIFSDQCPYVHKKILTYKKIENEFDIRINYIKLQNPKDYKFYGGVYGTFAIVVDGHYITNTLVAEKGLMRIIERTKKK